MPERPGVRDVLHQSALLNKLEAHALEELASACRMESAEKGETIWLSGKHTDYFGVVGAGFVKMVKTVETGQDLTHEIMGPGQVFGLMGTVDGCGCPLEARAVTGTWYVRVPKADFLKVYGTSHELKDVLIRRASVRLHFAHDMISRLSTGSVSNRVGAVLQILAGDYGHETAEGVEIRIPLRRQDIAELAGTTVESTIRVLSKWQKEGKIRSGTQSIVITDLEAMARESRI